MNYETIAIERVGDGVATLTLSRPEVLNAWNAQMAYEVDCGLRELDLDDSVRAIVLTGAGRAFCAGADLSSGGNAFSPPKDDPERQKRRQRGPVQDAMWPCFVRKPVIAAINGHAIGVGMTLPTMCDVRFVAENAKLQYAFVRRGVLPELGSHTIVARVVGLSNAADLLLTGRIFLGSEAAELGLATRALPADEVLPAALAHARQYRDAAPASVAISKKLLWEGMTMDVPQMIRREMPLFEWTTRQPDAQEGVVSFQEKRPAQWKLLPSTDLPEGL